MKFKQVLFKSVLVSSGGINNLKREVEIQSRMNHPNILKLHGYFYDDAHVHLILEYATQGELFKQLHKNKYLEESVAVHYISQVLDALIYCHQCNVIHRDIKVRCDFYFFFLQ
jgi:serine/threonine protein kinase